MGTEKAVASPKNNVFGLIRDAMQEGLDALREDRVRRNEREIPDPAPPLSAAQVAQLRTRMRLSQAEFAGLLSVSAKTIQAWEQGLRRPDGPARRLMQLLSLKPNFVVAAGKARAQSSTRTRRPSERAARKSG